MKNDIRITALIPAYNSEKFIARSINSAIKQTFQPCQIIIIDDGSTDGTAEVVKRYGDRVDYFYKKNGGPSSARNLGIKNAVGDWIAFLDSDDEWIDSHLENFVDVILQRPNLMWYGAPVRHLEEKTRLTTFTYKRRRHYCYTHTLCFEDYLSALPPAGFFSTPTMIIRKEIFGNIGLFNINKGFGEDVDMWFRIGLHIPEIGYCGLIGANVYKRTGSISSTKGWNPEQVLIGYEEAERLACNLGTDYAQRAEIRIMYWVKRLIRGAISRNDIATIKKVKARYFKRLPLMYKVVVFLILKFPLSIRTINAVK
ncbi:MAG TPA: glycosyltransferase family 2 protein [Bacteroidales bacterium]|nr:glycosyltransferase family 2 protein [Bacteroidales bacterium]